MFRLQGPATIAAVDNGDPTSIEPFINDNRRVFNGLGLVVLRSQCEPGEVILEAFAEGIEGTSVKIQSL
jgi:beta-galactosidase